ncbi:MAG: small subunit ribosomal protein S1, partial [Myxococcota bacterium]
MSTDVTKTEESLETKEAQAPEETQVSEDAVETEAALEAEAPEASEAEEAPVVEDAPPADGPVVLPELEEYSVFEAYVESLIAAETVVEGATVTGKVTAMDDMAVTVSIDEEHSCEIDRDEFLTAAGELTAQVGDEIQVYIDLVDEDGGVHLSKEKADKLALWNSLNKKSRSGELVRGKISGLAKGGFNVDIGVQAFLPGSQLDTRPRKAKQALGETHDFQVIKFDRARGAVVVSRRALLEKERAGMKEETLNALRVGAILNGFVKNITDYGCFVDVGGIDGLLHVTDMSWARITNPRSVVKVGEEITVQVLHFDTGTEKLKLGMKQITEDPWVNFERKHRVGQRIEGKVVNLTDFGAFLEIEDGIEGLVHVSALSWTKHVKKASDVLKKGDVTPAVILDIDIGARRISLGIKQTQANPWQLLADKLPIGSRVKGAIRSATNFGVFVAIEEGIDGLVHISDLAWDQSIKDPREHYTVGDELETILLSI